MNENLNSTIAIKNVTQRKATIKAAVYQICNKLDEITSPMVRNLEIDLETVLKGGFYSKVI